MQLTLSFDASGAQCATPKTRKTSALDRAGKRLEIALADHAMRHFRLMSYMSNDPAYNDPDRAYNTARLLVAASREVKAASIAHRKAAR